MGAYVLLAQEFPIAPGGGNTEDIIWRDKLRPTTFWLSES
jgi:hypothetical protein